MGPQLYQPQPPTPQLYFPLLSVACVCVCVCVCLHICLIGRPFGVTDLQTVIMGALPGVPACPCGHSHLVGCLSARTGSQHMLQYCICAIHLSSSAVHSVILMKHIRGWRSHDFTALAGPANHCYGGLNVSSTWVNNTAPELLIAGPSPQVMSGVCMLSCWHTAMMRHVLPATTPHAFL